MAFNNFMAVSVDNSYSHFSWKD